MIKTIITHVSPDFDAIAYIWLMKKYAPGFEDAEIKFMPLNNLDMAALVLADSVGDIGAVFDPERLRFDHHHLPGADSTATCAAMQAWEYLSAGQDLEYLRPLIKVIYLGDLAKTALVGIHSQMFGWKVAASDIGLSLSDYEVFSYGRQILEHNARWLEKKAADQAELEECVVWKSKDNLVWAIKGGSTGASFAAYDQGARVVVFEGKPVELADSTTTYPVGASRAPEWQEPDLGEIAGKLCQNKDSRIKREVATWFRHEAGFFTGRGSAKAPDKNPLDVKIELIAVAIDLVWER